jgi:serine/threonine protein kinase
MSFSPGQKVGDYEVLHLLGAGGLGAVYKAQHRISRRYEALKVALPERMETSEQGVRFEREIQVLAGLNHPHIAALHHAFYHGDELIMVMELVGGEDLRQRSRRATIPLPTLLHYAAQVLGALEYAHQAGVVHRDIKPANIMVTPEERIKVLDFGIATSAVSANLTATGAMIGSLNYISPEQIQGSRATPQSDLYSFGVTLYELITGRLPFEGATSFNLMQAHLEQTPAALAKLRPEIPAALSLAIAKAMAKDPRNRFNAAREFGLALKSNDAAIATITSTLPTASTEAGDGRRESGSASGDAAPSASGGRISSSTEPLPEALEQARKHLAEFIGPIAKVVVRRLAPRCADLEQLYREAAKEIATESERQRFLRLRGGRR